ncbi:putative 3-dehydroshikimate dehydratase protein [Phaeoacremonium minimum UCRPA7]|uniref:Putative 3-dehydroshikimate dehydratase protein n=1 Tax=Phaeoacremonium minimum (strain UCR-PA7) TaxID=1286976 RepID=R8BN17_PHAM7|nr:putative 3-dehydroshikimate dehydratase protein [Phaeoacremonium minimum UCRPA7]EOO00788.1 putative 3-dehydroshikimate dehydratase protein [Phaeoacremonium minimum UCRPA7]
MALSKVGITSISLGRSYARHQFVDRLAAAQQFGFDGIELAYEDLLAVTRGLNHDGVNNEPVRDALMSAARLVKDLCAQHDLEIICLQPFSQYEGLVDDEIHDGRIYQLHLWVMIAHELNTDLIQIPSNYLPADELTRDVAHMVRDLQEAADIGAAANPPIRFAYEAICWGTCVNTWEQSWNIVKAVDRDNFGLCLDTFHIAGRVFADPTVPDGKMPNAQQAVNDTLDRLVKEVDVKKVFYIQVVDAEKLTKPLVQGHEYYNKEQPARMSWSRNCRLFYGEEDLGAYLPIKQIATAIFDGLGYTGWVSLELFNVRMLDEGEEVPSDLAYRGAKSWHKLARDMNLRVGSSVREDS